MDRHRAGHIDERRDDEQLGQHAGDDLVVRLVEHVDGLRQLVELRHVDVRLVHVRLLDIGVVVEQRHLERERGEPDVLERLMSVAKRTWSVWSTTAEVLVTDPARLDAACAIAEERLRLVGDACDRFRSDSEVSRLRDRASLGVRISPVLADLVSVALDAAAATAGVVDPTLGKPLRAAGYDRDLRLVLDDGSPVRAVLSSRARWRSVRLEGDLLLVPDGVELDLGATAKARTADAIAATVAGTLRCGVLVNLGGDLAARGDAPEQGWQVTVRDLPTDPSTQISLPSGWALATSSTQRRTWTRAGEPMHHILDPRTGRPATPVWRCVSVAADTAVRANTLTTAAIVDGARALHRLCAAGFPARLVDAAGGVTHLNSWPDERRPTDESRRAA